MIFVVLGSQKFQFNRLLKKIDELIEEKKIREPVFAQSGACTYTPVHYESKPFLTRDEFNEHIRDCDILVTHGGTGAIINGIKSGKRVIAVPREAKYGEHVDNHQKEIIRLFHKKGYILGSTVDTLKSAIKRIDTFEPEPFVSNTEHVIDVLDGFISMCT